MRCKSPHYAASSFAQCFVRRLHQEEVLHVVAYSPLTTCCWLLSHCVFVCVCVFLCVCLHDKGLSLPNLQSARVRCDCRGETRGFALEPNFVEEELCSPKALPESRLHPSCTRTCNIPDLQLLHRLEVLTARCGMRRSCQWRQSRRCMRRPEGQGSLLILRAAPAFLLSVVA